jgi:hypothetical protein
MTADPKVSRVDVLGKQIAAVKDLFLISAMIVGAVWAVYQWSATHRKSEADEAELERKQKAAPHLEVAMTARVLQPGRSGGPKFIEAEVSLGSKSKREIEVTVSGASVKFYAARVSSIAADGRMKFGDPLTMVPEYADLAVEQVSLRPGDEPRRLHSVQRVDVPGLYLIRFVVTEIGKRKGYQGAETYVYVD